MRKLSLLLAAALVLCLAGGAWAGAKTFNFATFVPPNEPGAEVGLWIEKELNGQHGDKFKAKYFHSRQMGSAIEIVKKVRMGTLQAAFCPSTYAPDLDAKFGIGTLAYCMNKYSQWEALLANDALRDELFLSLQDKGLRCVDFTYYGIYGLATTKPVKTLADLKSMKMRTTQARYPLAFWHALGVNPVTMAWGDVFPALKQGVVDGTDQTRNVTLVRLSDVVNNFTTTNHMVGLFFLLVNDRWWNGLDDASRDALAKSIATNCDKARAKSRELTQAALPALQNKGVNVIELSDAEMDKFKASQQQVWKEFEPEVGKAWLDKITAFAAKH